jgi:hypothetical protein
MVQRVPQGDHASGEQRAPGFLPGVYREAGAGDQGTQGEAALAGAAEAVLIRTFCYNPDRTVTCLRCGSTSRFSFAVYYCPHCHCSHDKKLIEVFRVRVRGAA